MGSGGERWSIPKARARSTLALLLSLALGLGPAFPALGTQVEATPQPSNPTPSKPPESSQQQSGQDLVSLLKPDPKNPQGKVAAQQFRRSLEKFLSSPGKDASALLNEIRETGGMEQFSKQLLQLARDQKDKLKEFLAELPEEERDGLVQELIEREEQESPPETDEDGAPVAEAKGSGATPGSPLEAPGEIKNVVDRPETAKLIAARGKTLTTTTADDPAPGEVKPSLASAGPILPAPARDLLAGAAKPARERKSVIREVLSDIALSKKGVAAPAQPPRSESGSAGLESLAKTLQDALAPVGRSLADAGLASLNALKGSLPFSMPSAPSPRQQLETARSREAAAAGDFVGGLQEALRLSLMQEQDPAKRARLESSFKVLKSLNAALAKGINFNDALRELQKTDKDAHAMLTGLLGAMSRTESAKAALDQRIQDSEVQKRFNAALEKFSQDPKNKQILSALDDFMAGKTGLDELKKTLRDNGFQGGLPDEDFGVPDALKDFILASEAAGPKGQFDPAAAWRLAAALDEANIPGLINSRFLRELGAKSPGDYKATLERRLAGPLADFKQARLTLGNYYGEKVIPDADRTTLLDRLYGGADKWKVDLAEVPAMLKDLDAKITAIESLMEAGKPADPLAARYRQTIEAAFRAVGHRDFFHATDAAAEPDRRTEPPAAVLARVEAAVRLMNQRPGMPPQGPPAGPEEAALALRLRYWQDLDRMARGGAPQMGLNDVLALGPDKDLLDQAYQNLNFGPPVAGPRFSPELLFGRDELAALRQRDGRAAQYLDENRFRLAAMPLFAVTQEMAKERPSPPKPVTAEGLARLTEALVKYNASLKDRVRTAHQEHLDKSAQTLLRGIGLGGEVTDLDAAQKAMRAALDKATGGNAEAAPELAGRLSSLYNANVLAVYAARTGMVDLLKAGIPLTPAQLGLPASVLAIERSAAGDGYIEKTSAGENLIRTHFRSWDGSVQRIELRSGDRLLYSVAFEGLADPSMKGGPVAALKEGGRVLIDGPNGDYVLTKNSAGTLSLPAGRHYKIAEGVFFGAQNGGGATMTLNAQLAPVPASGRVTYEERSKNPLAWEDWKDGKPAAGKFRSGQEFQYVAFKADIPGQGVQELFAKKVNGRIIEAVAPVLDREGKPIPGRFYSFAQTGGKIDEKGANSPQRMVIHGEGLANYRGGLYQAILAQQKKLLGEGISLHVELSPYGGGEETAHFAKDGAIVLAMKYDPRFRADMGTSYDELKARDAQRDLDAARAKDSPQLAQQLEEYLKKYHKPVEGRRVLVGPDGKSQEWTTNFERKTIRAQAAAIHRVEGQRQFLDVYYLEHSMSPGFQTYLSGQVSQYKDLRAKSIEMVRYELKGGVPDTEHPVPGTGYKVDFTDNMKNYELANASLRLSSRDGESRDARSKREWAAFQEAGKLANAWAEKRMRAEPSFEAAMLDFRDSVVSVVGKGVKPFTGVVEVLVGSFANFGGDYIMAPVGYLTGSDSLYQSGKELGVTGREIFSNSVYVTYTDAFFSDEDIKKRAPGTSTARRESMLVNLGLQVVADKNDPAFGLLRPTSEQGRRYLEKWIDSNKGLPHTPENVIGVNLSIDAHLDVGYSRGPVGVGAATIGHFSKTAADMLMLQGPMGGVHKGLGALGKASEGMSVAPRLLAQGSLAGARGTLSLAEFVGMRAPFAQGLAEEFSHDWEHDRTKAVLKPLAIAAGMSAAGYHGRTRADALKNDAWTRSRVETARGRLGLAAEIFGTEAFTLSASVAMTKFLIAQGSSPENAAAMSLVAVGVPLRGKGLVDRERAKSASSQEPAQAFVPPGERASELWRRDAAADAARFESRRGFEQAQAKMAEIRERLLAGLLNGETVLEFDAVVRARREAAALGQPELVDAILRELKENKSRGETRPVPEPGGTETARPLPAPAAPKGLLGALTTPDSLARLGGSAGLTTVLAFATGLNPVQAFITFSLLLGATGAAPLRAVSGPDPGPSPLVARLRSNLGMTPEVLQARVAAMRAELPRIEKALQDKFPDAQVVSVQGVGSAFNRDLAGRPPGDANLVIVVKGLKGDPLATLHLDLDNPMMFPSRNGPATPVTKVPIQLVDARLLEGRLPESWSPLSLAQIINPANKIIADQLMLGGEPLKGPRLQPPSPASAYFGLTTATMFAGVETLVRYPTSFFGKTLDAKFQSRSQLFQGYLSTLLGRGSKDLQDPVQGQVGTRAVGDAPPGGVPAMDAPPPGPRSPPSAPSPDTGPARAPATDVQGREPPRPATLKPDTPPLRDPVDPPVIVEFKDGKILFRLPDGTPTDTPGQFVLYPNTDGAPVRMPLAQFQKLLRDNGMLPDAPVTFGTLPKGRTIIVDSGAWMAGEIGKVVVGGAQTQGRGPVRVNAHELNAPELTQALLDAARLGRPVTIISNPKNVSPEASALIAQARANGLKIELVEPPTTQPGKPPHTHLKLVTTEEGEGFFATGIAPKDAPLQRLEFGTHLPEPVAKKLHEYQRLLYDPESTAARKQLAAELAKDGFVLNDPDAGAMHLSQTVFSLLRAKESLTLHIKELKDAAATDQIIARAKEGVPVELFIRRPNDVDPVSRQRLIDAQAAGLKLTIKTYPAGTAGLPHGNVIIADGKTTYIGTAYLWSPQLNRYMSTGRSLESGIVLSQADTIRFQQQLGRTLPKPIDWPLKE